MAAVTDVMEGDFFRACKKNQVAEVKQLLDGAPGLIECLKQENNAVAYVCLQINTHGERFPWSAGPEDCLEMVRMLLDRGCDPNRRGNNGVMTALHYAANANAARAQVEIVRLLVQRGADPSLGVEWDEQLTPLNQHPPPPAAVADLLRLAPAIRQEWLDEVATAEAIPPIRALYPDDDPQTIFMKAIRYAREDDVRMVLQHYRDEVINIAKGNLAPIEHAATLISIAAPVTDGITEEKRRQRQYWQDPGCGMAMMELLLCAGENPNRRGCDTAITAIQTAATCNDRNLVILLLAYGADPTLKDLDGWSAMSVARHANNAAMIEILNGAAEIRAHFEATGRHEWPIVPDEPDNEPEPVPLQRQETEYQPQLVPGARLEQRLNRIKKFCLDISKEHGRPNKQKEVYESGVKCHVPQPPILDPDSGSDGPPSAEKVQYLKDRETFIAATIKELHGTDPKDWRHKTLQIRFHAQQGLDWGGLTKAFIKFMSDCLFDDALPHTLFEPLTTEDDSDELMGVPKVASLWQMKTDAQLAQIPDWRERMQWIGRFLGYCLWTGEAVNMPLLPSVYTYLLGKDDELVWRDVMLDAPKVYTGYTSPPDGLLAMPPENVEYIYLPMAVDDGAGGMFDLVEGGSDIDVTGENVRDYVTRSAMAKMVGLRRAGLEVLRAGFYDIIDQPTLHRIHREEVSWVDLQLMVNGIPEVDVQALQASTVYRNGDANMQKAKWFFQVLEGWQRGDPMCDDPSVRDALEEERHLGFGKQTKLVLKVFEYATGTDRMPAGGYQNLLDKGGNKCPFRIYNLDDEDKVNQIPRGHTCFNQLDLPNYDSRERLAIELHKGLVFGMGFGDY